MSALYAHHVMVDNNVFYSGERYLIKNENQRFWQITNNLLIGAHKRKNPVSNTKVLDHIALISMFNGYDPTSDGINVSYNVA